MKSPVIFLAVLLAFLSVAWIQYSNPTPIDRGLEFILKSQDPGGGFNTSFCGDKSCPFSPSPFETSMVIYAIKDIPDLRSSMVTSKGLDYLLASQEPDGSWRYWSQENMTLAGIKPDFDCVAVASTVLLDYNRSFRENDYLFSNYTAQNGVVYTWLNKTQNELDCEVNANIMLYYHLRKFPIDSLCAFISQNVIARNYSCCYYCSKENGTVDPLPIFYFVSRNFRNNVSCTKGMESAILEETLSRQESDGSWGNDFDTALALNTLLDFGYKGPEISRGIQYLILHQQKDGSWQSGHDGAETTAISLEALNKYGNMV